MFDKKIEALIKQLTLEEKIGMIHGDGLFQTKGVERLGIPPLKMADGPMGVRQDFQNDAWVAVNHSDDYVTYLPSGSAIASSWNKALAYQYGHVLGEEARGRSKDVILAPSINIIRSPLCGRNFEYLSEDPYLTKELAVPMVQGIQSHDVSCCVKHFAANNQETDRLKVDVIVDEKTLHEIYLPAFKAVVQQGKALSIMGAYNKINGEYCSQSPRLLNKILREQWGFDHMVISDWSAVNDTLKAANSGIDVEMSVHKNFDDYYMAKPLLEKVKNGEVSESKINEKVRNILNVMFKLHMIDDKELRAKGTYNTVEHQAFAYEIAKETIVLLKNDHHVLPLNKHIKKLLVIGDNANRLHSNEGGSAEIKALYEISPLMALKTKLGGQCQVDYVKGYYAYKPQEAEGVHWQETSLVTKEDKRDLIAKYFKDRQKALRDEAINLAKDYDQVIIFGGLNHTYDLEGQDRADIKLPYEQDALIKGVLEVQPNTILHILSAAAVDMSLWIDDVKTLIWSSYNGMHGGDALVDVIFGDVNPSGKLTQTFAQKLSDYSAHSIGEFPGTKQVRYLEGNDIGYRHFMKQKIEPIFVFGYGLSYTKYVYRDLSIDEHISSFDFNFVLENLGKFDGKEIVELFVTDLSDENQVKALKAFVKVSISKNESKPVTLNLLKSELSQYNIEKKAFEIKHSKYKISIGSSIKDIQFECEIEV